MCHTGESVYARSVCVHSLIVSTCGCHRDPGQCTPVLRDGPAYGVGQRRGREVLPGEISGHHARGDACRVEDIARLAWCDSDGCGVGHSRQGVGAASDGSIVIRPAVAGTCNQDVRQRAAILGDGAAYRVGGHGPGDHDHAGSACAARLVTSTYSTRAASPAAVDAT